jgi:hypothetical protein
MFYVTHESFIELCRAAYFLITISAQLFTNKEEFWFFQQIIRTARTAHLVYPGAMGWTVGV